jgi:hypothetical protein
MCDVPAAGFAANGAVFKKSGDWVDRFFYGTYRAFNDGGKPGSRPGKTDWSEVSWQTFHDQALTVGDGCHMLSVQEYHEVLARAVIEKKTFQLWPESVRRGKGATDFHGIAGIAYGPTSGVNSEWLDGILINSSENLEVFKDDGSRTYVDTGSTVIVNSLSPYIGTLQTGVFFDFMFIVSAGSPESASMIPDWQAFQVNPFPRVALLGSDTYNYYGPFSLFFNTHSGSAIGGRLAKV